MNMRVCVFFFIFMQARALAVTCDNGIASGVND